MVSLFPDRFIRYISQSHQLSPIQTRLLHQLFCECKSITEIIEDSNKEPVGAKTTRDSIYKQLSVVYEVFSIEGNSKGKLQRLNACLHRSFKYWQQDEKIKSVLNEAFEAHDLIFGDASHSEWGDDLLPEFNKLITSLASSGSISLSQSEDFNALFHKFFDQLAMHDPVAAKKYAIELLSSAYKIARQ